MLRGSLVPVFTLDFAWSASNLIHHYRVAATVGSNPTVTVVSFCHLVFHPTWGDGQWNGLIGYCEVVGSKMPPKSPRQPWFDRFLGEVVFAMWMAKLTIQTFFGWGDPTILWREAHFQVKSVKNWRSRTTFGGSDVEKVSKKCTPLWHEAHFEVKRVKNWGFWAFFDVKMSKK